jgi:hypothetical protein
MSIDAMPKTEIPKPPEHRTYAAVRERLDTWDQSGVAYEACPTPIDTFAQALSVWVQLGVEGVSVEVPPGFALAGMPVYVLLDGPEGLSADASVADLTIGISAWPTYTIDFGDGSEPVTTQSHGVAYPGGDGEISHIYTDAAPRTITVTTTWQATFTAPGETVTLPPRQVVDTYDLTVHEYRAVRTGN